MQEKQEHEILLSERDTRLSREHLGVVVTRELQGKKNREMKDSIFTSRSSSDLKLR